MKYTQPTFTLPVSQGVSQDEWDRIFNGKAALDPEEFADRYQRLVKPRAEGRSNWTCTCSDCTKVRRSMKRTRTKRRDALTSADKD